MSYQFHNTTFQLALKPDRSSWDLYDRESRRPILENVRMSVQYHRKRKHGWELEKWDQCQVGLPEKVVTSHGTCQHIVVKFGPSRSGLTCSINFLLPEIDPALLWNIQIENNSHEPIVLEQLELLNVGFFNISHGSYGSTLPQAIVRAENSAKARINLAGKHSGGTRTTGNELAFFSNGWQSWSYTGVYTSADYYETTRLGFLRRAMIANASTPSPMRPGLISSDMFGVLGDRQSRKGILVGFLSQKKHFGSLQAYLAPHSPALRMWASGDGVLLDPGDRCDTDWACIYELQIDTPDPLSPYLDAVRREHNLGQSTEVGSPTGWCSWYYFSADDYTGTVTPQAIRENTQAAASFFPQLPLDIIQIDDGYEHAVGDWFEPRPEFTNQLAPLAAEIREAGFSPGLWLAPFILHPKSQIFTQHPEWILRSHSGKPVNAGFCWNAFTRALDLTQPGALDYCQEVVHKAVNDWGYSYLKLDFLYAAALPGRFYNVHKSRAQVLREGLQALRAAAGQKTTLLGCGCPLGPAIGLVDTMRIGTDTVRRWYPSVQGIKFFVNQDKSLPSAASALHNALTRSSFHQRWWTNDPDCLLVRPESELTLAEVQTIATVIALTGGSLFLSDNLPSLPEERLRIAKSLLPLIDKRPFVLDWFDQPTPSIIQLDMEGAPGHWSLLAIINWNDYPLDRVLKLNQTYLDPDQIYLGREFWSGQNYLIESGKLSLPQIPAHGVKLLAVKPFQPQGPIYAGSDLHISQGYEVIKWQFNGSRLDVHLQRPGNTEGILDIYVQKPPEKVTVDDHDAQWVMLDGSYCRVKVAFIDLSQLALDWEL